MKKRHFVMGAAILVLATVLATFGAYLKYDVLKPLNLYQDKNIFELPFLMYSDEYLQFLVEHAEEIKQMEHNPSTGPSGSNGSTGPTGSNGNTNSTVRPTGPSTDSSASTDTTVDTSDSTGTKPTDSTTSEPTTESNDSISSFTTTDSTTSSSTNTTAPSTSQSGSKEPNFDFPGGVSDDWFENTLFIGDSRVVGLREYARSGNADYFCDVGMTVFSSYDEDTILSDRNFSNKNLKQLLSENQYDKIILNFGLNECGYMESYFKLCYTKLVDMIRQLQPDAIIILNGIMSVSESKANSAEYFRPAYIAQRSAVIQSLCDGETVFYIDCNEYFADENGYMFSEITNDGYHLTAAGYRHWRNWMSFAIEQLGL